MEYINPTIFKSRIIEQCYTKSRRGRKLNLKISDKQYTELKKVLNLFGMIKLFGELELFHSETHYYIHIDVAANIVVHLNKIIPDVAFKVSFKQSDGVSADSNLTCVSFTSPQQLGEFIPTFHGAARKVRRTQKKSKSTRSNEQITRHLGHAKKALASNKRLLSIDVEAFERNQKKVTEIGLCVFDGERETTTHIVISENKKHRNGKFVADNRDNFIFGETIELPMSEAIERVKEQLQLCDFLVGHGLRNDIVWLTQIGVKSVTKVPRIDTSVIAKWAFQNKQTIGLENMLKRLGIDYQFLHNAGNDCAFTMQALKTLTTVDPSCAV